jgi:hypothetical protein
MDTNTAQPRTQEIAQCERKTYSTPTLTDFGSFAEITNGTLAGVGADSAVYS